MKMSKFSQEIEVSGHLIDSSILTKIFDKIMDLKGEFNVEEIDIGNDVKKRDEMLKKSNGAKTVPQIFIGEKHVGGYVELKALENKGELDTLLKN